MRPDPAALAPFAGGFARSASEVLADLEAFMALVGKWQRVQNLVSRETGDALWTRHVLDGLQLLNLLPADTRTIVDLGSGGGFPAIPMAIGLKGSGARFRLIEANQRKGAFLKAVARELELAVAVHVGRVEALAERRDSPPDVVTARAVAPLPALLGLVHAVWVPGCLALLPKGREVCEEIAEARAIWRFDMIQHRSRTDESGAVLEVRNLERR